MRDQLRQLIRELIEQEVATLVRHDPRTSLHSATPLTDVREEQVSLNTDAELAQFVSLIIELCDDPGSRAALTKGQYRFRLAESKSQSRTSNRSTVDTMTQTGNGVAHIESGVLTERECNRLAPGVSTLVLGRSVRITPLAADRLRKRGITTTRGES